MADAVDWARRLQAIAQSGLTYTENEFDRARFEAVRQLAAEIAASTSGEDAVELAALFAAETGYATPKLDVRGVVRRDDRLLLVREHGFEGWNLPGGWVDVGETLREAAAKEVLEETGFATRPVRLLALRSRDLRGRSRWPAHVYKVYVECELEAEAGPPDPVEVAEVGFFALSALPRLSVKTPAEDLDDVLALLADERAPVLFD